MRIFAAPSPCAAIRVAHPLAQLAIKRQVTGNHLGCGEASAPRQRLLPQALLHPPVGAKRAELFLQIIGRFRVDEDGRTIPKLAQAGYVPEHQRAARKCGLQDGQAERLVAGRQRVDRGSGVPGSQRFGREESEPVHPLHGYRSPAGVAHLPRHVHRPGEVVGVSRQRADILRFIPETSHREDELLLFAGTEPGAAARVIDDAGVGKREVEILDVLQHGRRRGCHQVGRGKSLGHPPAILQEPRREFLPAHRLPPGKHAGMGHHQAGALPGERGVGVAV